VQVVTPFDAPVVWPGFSIPEHVVATRFKRFDELPSLIVVVPLIADEHVI
jgi:hypothetical protein